MRKKVLITLVIILVISLVGCAPEESVEEAIENNTLIKTYGKVTPDVLNEYNARLLPTEFDHLSYDKETKIVYYYFTNRSNQTGYGFMSPYYSENGKLVKYDIDSKTLVELE